MLFLSEHTNFSRVAGFFPSELNFALCGNLFVNANTTTSNFPIDYPHLTTRVLFADDSYTVGKLGPS